MLALGWRSALGPTIFALVAIVLLVYDHLVRSSAEHFDGSGYPDGCPARRSRWARG